MLFEKPLFLRYRGNTVQPCQYDDLLKKAKTQAHHAAKIAADEEWAISSYLGSPWPRKPQLTQRITSISDLMPEIEVTEVVLRMKPARNYRGKNRGCYVAKEQLVLIDRIASLELTIPAVFPRELAISR